MLSPVNILLFGDVILSGTEQRITGRQLLMKQLKKARKVSIITLMWHEGRPTDDPPYGWKESMQAKLTDAQWNELTTPGTELI